MLVNKPQTKHKAWVANPKSRRYCKSPRKGDVGCVTGEKKQQQNLISMFWHEPVSEPGTCEPESTHPGVRHHETFQDDTELSFCCTDSGDLR